MPMPSTQRRVAPLRLLLRLSALFLLLLAATPAAARMPIAATSAAPAQTATLSNSRVVTLRSH